MEAVVAEYRHLSEVPKKIMKILSNHTVVESIVRFVVLQNTPLYIWFVS
jgi:hypothetical protein